MSLEQVASIADNLSTGKAKKTFGPNATDEQVLRFGCRSDGFHVGVRYRDEKVSNVAYNLFKLKLLRYKKGKRYGDGRTYFTTELGRSVLNYLRERNLEKES